MKNILSTALIVIMLPLCAVAQTTASQQDQVVHINEIQVIGSHNSYHTGIAPSERKLIEQQNPKAMRAAWQSVLFLNMRRGIFRHGSVSRAHSSKYSRTLTGLLRPLT